MKNHNGSKVITVDILGQMLEKYISPIYKELGIIKSTMNSFRSEMDSFKSTMDSFGNEMETLKTIQLRMEHRLTEDNRILHDRDDDHDKKLKNHEKRIVRLENPS